MCTVDGFTSRWIHALSVLVKSIFYSGNNVQNDLGCDLCVIIHWPRALSSIQPNMRQSLSSGVSTYTVKFGEYREVVLEWPFSSIPPAGATWLIVSIHIIYACFWTPSPYVTVTMAIFVILHIKMVWYCFIEGSFRLSLIHAWVRFRTKCCFWPYLKTTQPCPGCARELFTVKDAVVM